MTSLWTNQTSLSTSITWSGITYGKGQFVAVGYTTSGTLHTGYVATSLNGTNWTTYQVGNRQWLNIGYGNGYYVAVSSASTSSPNPSGFTRAMYSTDGVSWTQSSGTCLSNSNNWRSVAYGASKFVAVNSTPGQGNIMYSIDNGANWTYSKTGVNNYPTSARLYSVTYGQVNGQDMFVAVGYDIGISPAGYYVFTSPDGLVWTQQTPAANNQWTGVTYGQVNGQGLFVAVSNTGTGNRVMTSPNGSNWTLRASASDINWSSVTYGNGLFVAVANSGIGTQVMSSSNGINWSIASSSADSSWSSVTYGNGIFAAVASSGSDSRAMTSVSLNPTLSNFPNLDFACSVEPFTIKPPTSNSNGAITYTSSNPAVAVINGTTVTIVGIGKTIITATQAATASYTTGSISALMNVVPCPIQRNKFNTWANGGVNGRTGQTVALGKNRATIASIGRVYKFCDASPNNNASKPNTYFCMFGNLPY